MAGVSDVKRDSLLVKETVSIAVNGRYESENSSTRSGIANKMSCDENIINRNRKRIQTIKAI
jgi:hypothetical protein